MALVRSLLNARLSSLRTSLNHSTTLAIAAHSSHCSNSSGTVPKARLRKSRLTTATCSSTDSAIAPQSHGLTNRCANALAVSERALKQLNSWAKTSTVKPAVRAEARSCVPSISPPGRYRSIVSNVTIAITAPIWITPDHMRASIARSLERRGLRPMRSLVGGSTPIAKAGPESVIRLIHRIWVASSGSTKALSVPVSPITPAPTTPRKTVNTSPMFEERR